MGRREKQFKAMKNNPNGVKFDELTSLLEWLGYRKKQGKKQSHYTFIQPDIGSVIRLAEDHGNRVNPIYIRQVITEIESYPILWQGRKE